MVEQQALMEEPALMEEQQAPMEEQQALMEEQEPIYSTDLTKYKKIRCYSRQVIYCNLYNWLTIMRV